MNVAFPNSDDVDIGVKILPPTTLIDDANDDDRDNLDKETPARLMVTEKNGFT